MSNVLLDMVLETQRVAQDEAFKMWQRYLNVPKAVETARDVQVALTPHDVVYEEGTLQLLHYRNEHSINLVEPILICYALVNRPSILDLSTERSVVRQLLKRGFDVYLIDWGVPTAADRTLRLEDYVCGYMKRVADVVCARSGSEKFNLLGYCMGGTMSAMFAALFPERVRNLILMAAPIDFSADDGLLSIWTDEKYFDVDAFVDAYGNCPGSFLQATFLLMKPVDSFYEKYVRYFEEMYDDRFLENFFAMERWVNDNIPVAGETFREFVKKLYQANALVRGEMSLGGRRVQLDQITCPLLMLVADYDHLVPADSTLALEKFVGSGEVKSMRINAGHIGLAVSSKAHKQLWPDAALWIADRSTERG